MEWAKTQLNSIKAPTLTAENDKSTTPSKSDLKIRLFFSILSFKTVLFGPSCVHYFLFAHLYIRYDRLE